MSRSLTQQQQREYRECILLETNRTVNQRGNPTSDEQRHGLVHRQAIGETGKHKYKAEPARAATEQIKRGVRSYVVKPGRQVRFLL